MALGNMDLLQQWMAKYRRMAQTGRDQGKTQTQDVRSGPNAGQPPNAASPSTGSLSPTPTDSATVSTGAMGVPRGQKRQQGMQQDAFKALSEDYTQDLAEQQGQQQGLRKGTLGGATGNREGDAYQQGPGVAERAQANFNEPLAKQGVDQDRGQNDWRYRPPKGQRTVGTSVLRYRKMMREATPY